MPGKAAPDQKWMAQLEEQSTELDIHVKQLDITLGRQVAHSDDKMALTGEDHLKVRTGPVILKNKGKAATHFSAEAIVAQGSRRGE